MRLGRGVLRNLVRPQEFWKTKLPKEGKDARAVPPACRKALERALPAGTTDIHVRTRQAGKGSLGRQRFVAIGRWNGGRVAREAKAVVPSAALWAKGDEPRRGARTGFEHLLRASIRSPDPFLRIEHGWVVRRLAPDSDKIEIRTLGRAREVELAELMGREVANVHLATPRAANAILSHLAEQPSSWLVKAARAMARITKKAHKAWTRSAG